MSEDFPRPRTSEAPRRRPLALAATAALAVSIALPLGAAPAAADDGGLPGSELYLNPWSTTLEAAQSLDGQARADAQLLGSIPSADWFTTGTPDEVRAAVDDVVTAAAAQGRMPVLVAYNLPFRDCAQYSAGGALDTAAYQAWIDAFAAGIGDRPATVILEPDGLGIIPHYVTIDGVAEWCQPAELDPETAASDRFVQLNHAVDALGALAATSVYLDGTGSSWLGVGDIADRLLKAGVDRADGFFLNASNYQFTTNSVHYGTWVSSCLAYVTEVNPGGFGDCGNQYWNGGPATGWNGVAMSPYGEWSPDAADPALSTAGLESRYDLILGDVEPSIRFVVDTSRNGLGPWDYPEGVYPAHEDWCNPPDRGLGLRPDTTTGVPLVDAYLWIKVPGESDGKCYRGTGGPLDPARGIEDPAAGQWFAEQARELIALANPPLAALTCDADVKVVGTGKGFHARMIVRNDGDALASWTLSWSAAPGQSVTKVVGGSFVQDGAVVTVTGDRPLRAGKSATVVVSGSGPAVEAWQFRVNDGACTS
jgi:endoglucanase